MPKEPKPWFWKLKGLWVVNIAHKGRRPVVGDSDFHRRGRLESLDGRMPGNQSRVRIDLHARLCLGQRERRVAFVQIEGLDLIGVVFVDSGQCDGQR